MRRIIRKPFKRKTKADAQATRKDSPLICLGDRIATWQPGQSGNPKGRPPLTKCISDNLRAIGDTPAPPTIIRKLERSFGCKMPKDMSFVQAVAFKTLLQAAEGEGYARDFLTNRAEGILTTKLELENKGPPSVNVNVSDKKTADSVVNFIKGKHQAKNEP